MNWKALIFQTIAKHHTIGETESTHFQQAAVEYANILHKDPCKIPAAAVAAFNRKLPENAQELDTPETLITAQWDTFRNKYPDRPVTLIRSVMVIALLELFSTANHKSILYLSLVDLLVRMTVSHESPLRDTFIANLKPAFEKIAVFKWEHVADLSPKTIDINFNFKISDELQEELLEDMKSAINNGHHIGQTHNRSYGNWEPLQHTEAWATRFAERSTKVITDALQALIGILNTELPKFVDNVKTATDSQVEVHRSVKRQEQRGKVLWWLQVKYSPSAKVSYRKLNPIDGAVRMAVDLLDLIPVPVPEHVEVVLVEAMLSTYGEKAELEVSLLTVLKELEFPKDMASSLPVLGALINPKLSKKTFETSLGLHPSVTVTAVQFAVWIFRLLQVRKLL